MKQHRSFFSTTQLILLSFLAAILLGTALLVGMILLSVMLPLMNIMSVIG